MFPWVGKEMVLLTTRDDLDPEVLAVFLDRLDGGWRFYAEVIGEAPKPRSLVLGKPPIAAIPAVELTCGYGCGQLGSTGIEVTAFDRVDYPMVAKDRTAFPHYYFYEMGRNWFVFGDRHSAFTTGYAVFMRYAVMDALGCLDLDADTRRQIEAAEGAYAGTDMPFLRAFTTRGGLDEKEPRLPGVAGPSDQPVIYASAMLKLYTELGGKALVAARSSASSCGPRAPADVGEAALSQARAWLVAASIAAGKDLSPIFVDRWRLPMGPKARKALAGIRWTSKDLHVPAVLRKLPDEPAR